MSIFDSSQPRPKRKSNEDLNRAYTYIEEEKQKLLSLYHDKDAYKKRTCRIIKKLI